MTGASALQPSLKHAATYTSSRALAFLRTAPGDMRLMMDRFTLENHCHNSSLTRDAL